MKRVKPTSEQIEKTRRTQGAKEQMYAKMAQGAIEALINREMNMLLTFPYFIKFQKGFPKGVLVEKTQTTNTYKVKTRKLLDWLHSKGYSKYSSEEVMDATRSFSYNLTRMVNQLEDDFVDGETEDRLE